MKKNFTLSFIVIWFPLFSQVGINTPNPNPKSILDIFATDKGVLLPRLTTTERDNIPDLGTAELGMTVFNTNTKCYNVWNGTSWYDACGTDVDGVSELSFNCGTTSLSSNLIVGEPANSVITLEINAATPGSWDIQSNTISGVSYSGSGIITSPGPQVIKLTASGTPTAPNNSAVFNFSNSQLPPIECSVMVKIIDRSTKSYTVLSLLPESWNSALGPTTSSFTSILKTALTSNFSPGGTVKIAGFNYTEGTATESLATFSDKLNAADIIWCGWPDTNSWRLYNDKIQLIKAWIDSKKGVAIFHADDSDHAIFANILGYAGPYYGNQAGIFTNQNETPLNGSFGDLRSQTFPFASSGANQSAVLGGGTVLATGSGTNNTVPLIILKDNYIILGNVDWAGNSSFTATNVFGKLYMNIFEWAVKIGPVN